MANLIYLKLNQHSTDKKTPDTSGNGHTSTFVGNTQLETDKTFGTCTGFDGNGDCIDCGNGFSPNINTWTVSIWFNASEIDKERIIYNKEDLFEAAVKDGFFQYAWQPHWHWDGEESFPVEAGKWYHATVVYDGKSQKVYKNGVKVYERAQTGNIPSNANKLLLAARGHTNPHAYFAGKLAHFRIYDQALSIGEINEVRAKDAAGLFAHFSLDEHTEDNRVIDNVGKHIGQLKGNTMLVPDETFGAVLSFDGSGDFIEIPDSPDLRLEGDMAVSCWVYIEKSIDDWVRIIGKGNSGRRNYGLWYHPTSNQWLFQQKTPAGGWQQAYTSSGSQWPVQLNRWYHVVGVKDGSEGILYLNGEKIQTYGNFGPAVTSNDPLTIGFAGYHSAHTGKIAQARIYGRAISEEEIQQIMDEDRTALATFHQTHPLEFKLLDEHNQAVLYIDENPQGHQMHVTIENTSKQAIQFAATVQHEANEHIHNFALKFRPGTLSEDSLDKIKIVDNPRWRVKTIKAPNGEVSIYLLATHTPKIAAGESETITLSNFKADGTHGTRGTRVEFFYQHMAYDGTTHFLKGERLTHLNIVNHSGKKNIPLHVGFVGGNRILNDAVDDDSGTENRLELRINNALKLDPANPQRSNITLKGKNSDSPTKFILSFDVQNDNDDTYWALGTKSQVANIEIRPKVLEGQSFSWTPAVGKPGDTFMLDQDVTLEAGTVLAFSIDNIKSSLPSGHTNLYIHYENIPGYWDGQFVEVVEKSPLIYHTNPSNNFESVGIGTAAPKAKLDVNGAAHVQGMLDIGVSDGQAIKVNPASRKQVYIGRYQENSLIFDWGQGQGLNSTANLTFNIDSDNSNTGRYIDFKHNGNSFSTGNSLMRIQDNGNVGIGEKNPDWRLTVDGPIVSYSRQDNRRKGWTAYWRNDHVTLNAYDWDGGGLQPLRIDGKTLSLNGQPASGNVGIGTTNPQAKLDIGLSEGHALRVSPAVGKRVYIGSSEANGMVFDSIMGQAINSSANLTFNVETNKDDTERYIDFKNKGKDFGAGNLLMRINHNGNVGIGTNNPRAKLHLSGGRGSVELLLEADTDNRGEGDQPRITLTQDNKQVVGQLGYFDSTNSLSLINRYGKTKVVLNENGNTEIWSSSTAFLVQGDGNIVAYRGGKALWATGTNVSDINLKEAIKPIENPLERLCSLRGISFDWKDKNIGKNREFGVVAQEVEATFPELMQDLGDDSKLVQYEKFVPILIEAVKEQQVMINDLQQKLAQ